MRDKIRFLIVLAIVVLFSASSFAQQQNQACSKEYAYTDKNGVFHCFPPPPPPPSR